MRKKTSLCSSYILIMFFIGFLGLFMNCEDTKPIIIEEPELILNVADFENFNSPFNLLDGEIGTWNMFPLDTTQGTKISYVEKIGREGSNCLRIEYDVDSPNPAISGVYFKLNDSLKVTRDLTPYKYLVIWVEGDDKNDFTARFQIELQRPEATGEKERYFITGITTQWQQFKVELEKFQPWLEYKKISDWSKIEELTITFADQDLEIKEGTLYIDDIYFTDL